MRRRATCAEAICVIPPGECMIEHFIDTVVDTDPVFTHLLQQVGPAVPFSREHPCACGAIAPHQLANGCMLGEIPMGVSKWQEHGKKFGYWEFFKKEILGEATTKGLVFGLKLRTSSIVPKGEIWFADDVGIDKAFGKSKPLNHG